MAAKAKKRKDNTPLLLKVGRANKINLTAAKCRPCRPCQPGKGIKHKAYSYRRKGGKLVHVAAHVEHPCRK